MEFIGLYIYVYIYKRRRRDTFFIFLSSCVFPNDSSDHMNSTDL